MKMGSSSGDEIIELHTRTNLRASVKVPGSKSITQRVLVIASLADGESELRGPLDSEDTLLLRNSLRLLGISIQDKGPDWTIGGQGGRILPTSQSLYLGNNGTGMRFLTSLVCLGQGTYRLTGARRMSERPIAPLLKALKAWGVKARSTDGCPPLEIDAHGLDGGEALLSASKSSQYLSSMLLIGPYAETPARIRLEGPLVSRPYVDMTMAVMSAFGIGVREEGNTFYLPQGTYKARGYPIEGDASSASYFWAAAAVTGSRITVENIPPDSLQGDVIFADILATMGCSVERGPGGITIQGPDRLRAIEIDMGKWPDLVPGLAVVAAFANGTTVIKNVAHLRIKETDRLKALAQELSRIGASVQELEDGLVIRGGRDMHGAVIDTYRDHRMAMAFAISSLRVPGIKIRDPDCVQKSFPSFWDLWQDIGR